MNTQTLLSRAAEIIACDYNLWNNKPVRQTELLIQWDKAVTLIRDMKAALEEREWKSIELAPRDGTQILASLPDGSCAILSWFKPPRRLKGRWGKWKEDKKKWNPTHFMNLPKPPIGESCE